MSQPKIELSYAEAKVSWYRQPRVQQWAIRATILIALLWISQFLPSIWTRYRYYRIQQQAATYLIGPSQVLVNHSTTQPYGHVQGPADQFVSAFWMAASQAHLSSIGLTSIPNATPIFCGLRTTSGGRQQIVQAYSSITTIGDRRGLSIIAVTSDWHAWNWIFTGRQNPKGIALGPGMDLGNIFVPTDPTDKVQVCSGVANPSDSTEVDVAVVFNGQPTTVKVHIVEISKSPVNVGIATERAALATAFGKIHGWNTGGFWDWPFTGK